MIVYPSLPGGYTIFCDDIRHELHGKESLVGTYASVMYVRSSFPVTLPKFCMMIVLLEETDSLEPVSVKVFFPGQADEDDPTIAFDMHPQPGLIPPPSDEFTMRESRYFIELPNIEIKEQGKIRVRAYGGGNEIRLGSLTVARTTDEPETPSDQDPASEQTS